MDTGTAREDHGKIKARYYTSNHIVAVNNVLIPKLKPKGCCMKTYFLVLYTEIWTKIDTAPYKNILSIFSTITLLGICFSVLAAWYPQPMQNIVRNYFEQ